MLLEKLKGIADRFEEVGRLITEPDVINDMKRYVQLNKEYKELSRIVEFYREYKNILDNTDSTRRILETEKDEEMREMAKEELDTLITRRQEMEEEIRCSCSRLIRRMPGMPSSRSVPERVGTRPAFLRATCSACTSSSLTSEDGNTALTTIPKGPTEATRRSYLQSAAKGFMAS